jgi:eukaryotic-like serine/threonine-protein kinase
MMAAVAVQFIISQDKPFQGSVPLELEAMAAWANGIQLGPYVLLEPIGAGGMGEVWKARDTRLGRVVAIKRLKGQHTARFEQEARAIAALNHPNICTLHDIGPDYLVMEYVEGKPVQGPLAAEEAVRLAIQIAGALEEAHARGILHRDLKPANILVTSKGAKLLDFGLAKLSADSPGGDATLTIEGTVLGTAAYMAPEQAQGKAADARSDVFSFGAVLYEMLSGNRAFSGVSTAEVLSSVLRDEPSALKAPAELERIVRRCLAKQPAQRFQSMAEVHAALVSAGHARPVEQGPSIAVLPFANMSADPEQEFFSDGLAEEIINSLVQVPGLKVIARTSAFAFKGQHTDVRKIAEVLGVSTVLEGSVRKMGNRIRVTAQLITASDGSHLWSERYDRELADVFAVQDEIAAAIAAVLKVKLVSGPRKYTPNLPAYEAYLKARHQRGRLTLAAITQYREYLEQAIALDPGFALAYVDMADSHLMLSSLTANEMLQARDFARRALGLDPFLAEAQAMLGIVASVYDYDWKESERRFALAMAHDPVPAQVRQWYGYFYLLPTGRYAESAEAMALGLREDPLNILSREAMASCLIAAGRLEDAANELRESIKLDEGLFLAYFTLSLTEAARGAFAEAAAWSEKALALMRWPVGVGLWAGLLAKIGETKRSEELLQELGDGSAWGAPLGLTYFHLLSGNPDRAEVWVRKGIEQRHPLLLCDVLPHPMAAPLRASAHWPPLAKMMNLPETAV